MLKAAQHPGEYVREKLAERGWSQRDLAFAVGLPETTVNVIVQGKRGLTADTAKLFSQAFGIPAEEFLAVQSAFELSKARSPDAKILSRIRLQSSYPLREMIKRGWLENAVDLDRQLAKFLEVASPDEIPHLDHAARKSDYSDVPPVQLAWLFRVKQIAREMVVPKYSPKALTEALSRLQALMSAPEESRHVPRLLSECGVRFVIVECLPSAKIDGVCLWLNNGAFPVIGMSLRFDRIDNFWFVLRHEIEHILQKHGQISAMIDAELEGEKAGTSAGLPEEERLANLAASEFCVPSAQLESFIARKHPFYSEREFLGFAKRLQVHPGVVAGQLRSKTQNWKLFTKFLVKVRHLIAPSAVVDGWGDVAPVTL